MASQQEVSKDIAKRAVRALAVSQAELAERLGVSIYTVRAWVSGRNGPLPETALLLADLLTSQSDSLSELAEALRNSVGDQP